MQNTSNFKTLLDAELKTLEAELKSLGQRNPSNPNDWEAAPGEFSTDRADENEIASNIEQYEDKTAILKQLEIRYNEVKAALARIEDGSYGKCAKCGKEIEAERLEANPAATTCVSCMQKEE